MHLWCSFQAAKRAGWLPANDSLYPKVTHVGFGLVLGEDGKRFRTRNTEVVRLVDLLDEAKNRSKAALIERGEVPVATLWFSIAVIFTAYLHASMPDVKFLLGYDLWMHVTILILFSEILDNRQLTFQIPMFL